MAEWVAEVARGATNGKLKNLVLNCHGAPGYLELGQGITESDLREFRIWHGLIEKIWIPACSENPGKRRRSCPGRRASGKAAGDISAQGVQRVCSLFVLENPRGRVKDGGASKMN
jgi:hypothetical protein